MNTPRQQPNSPSPSEEFVQLFTRHQRRVYLFILSQIPDATEAEEVLQEANVVILRKCDQFEMGTNFLAWACSVARFEILKHHDRHKRDRHYFSSEFLELVARETVKRDAITEMRREALTGCIQKLNDVDRELVQLRYATGNDGNTVAEKLGRPRNSIYQSLGRIRKVLLDCVNRTLTAETT
ncbi:MAG: sigma-70 family RNA polymerase sigma factor [Planctomycetaceae bacterium]